MSRAGMGFPRRQPYHTGGEKKEEQKENQTQHYATPSLSSGARNHVSSTRILGGVAAPLAESLGPCPPEVEGRNQSKLYTELDRPWFRSSQSPTPT